MPNRYDMAFNPAPTYFGIKRFVEETKRKEEMIISENNPENIELYPGTYMTDQVHFIHQVTNFILAVFCFSISKTALPFLGRIA